MRHAALANENCSIARTVAILGERWTMVILRQAFLGARRFEDYQSGLGIARNMLTDRLRSLVEHGILERQPDPADRRKVAYRLTRKGRELLPVLIALRQWGERWVSGVPSNPVLVDRQSRRPVSPMAVRAADGRPLTLSELEWLDRSELGEA